jgi:uncharacterized membrane protein YhaH (DUF805 family)
MNWYLKVLRQYADFDGRARRKEYWMFVLFNMFFSIVTIVLDNMLGTAIEDFGYGLFYIVYALAVLVPGLAVTVRRLHDIGKSGWTILIVLIPIVGVIFFLVLAAEDSSPGENKYGPRPYESVPAESPKYERFTLRPEFTLILGLVAGLIIGYVLAERQAVPPAKAIKLGLNPQAAAQQGEELPTGHPPVDGASGADAQRLRQQVAELEGLMASNPNDAGLLAAMGNIYFDASRWPDARDWYEKSLQVSSGDPNVLTDLAVVYRNLGDFERTIELLDQAIAINSGHWQAWYNKVVVYQFDLHQHDDAAGALKTLQELKKSNSAIPDLSGLEQEVHGD